MQHKFIFLLLVSSSAFPSWSQSSESQAHKPLLKWSVSTGANHYTEPGLMQLKGPEAGVQASLSPWSALPHLQLEADIFLGRQNYTSTNSGSMRGISNLETRWRALLPLFSDSSSNAHLRTGLAVHTLWNDLRGTTTYQGKTYGGYERSAAQLWLPVRWTHHFVELEAGVLVYGRHTSKQSQVNTTPPSQDVVNTQKKGAYWQTKLHIDIDGHQSLKPYIRYTYLGDSDIVNRAYEPASKRWQAGLAWEFSAP